MATKRHTVIKLEKSQAKWVTPQILRFYGVTSLTGLIRLLLAQAIREYLNRMENATLPDNGITNGNSTGTPDTTEETDA